MSLQVERLSKRFLQGENSIQVLDNLSLHLETGDTAAILGQSGSGKSTLLALLCGLDKPDSGGIRIGSTMINPLTENQLTRFRARNIGIVFQQFHLLPTLTALENVLLPLEINNFGQRGEVAKDLLTRFGLSRRLNHFPHQMSGGECQRVAMARAIVCRPLLLLADEPSGNLDLKTGQEVMSHLFQIVEEEKMTTIVVTHSEDVARQCRRSFDLRDGRLTLR